METKTEISVSQECPVFPFPVSVPSAEIDASLVRLTGGEWLTDRDGNQVLECRNQVPPAATLAVLLGLAYRPTEAAERARLDAEWDRFYDRENFDPVARLKWESMRLWTCTRVRVPTDDQLAEALRALPNYVLPSLPDCADEGDEDDETLPPELALVERLAYFADLGSHPGAPAAYARLARIVRCAVEAKHVEEQMQKSQRVVEMSEPQDYMRPDQRENLAQSIKRACANSPRQDLVYHPDAAPPFDAFVQISHDREFSRTWSHKRSDLPDQSIETYDHAIATQVIRAGWTDQQVVNLLIAHRNLQFEPLLLGGPYYADLLARVKLTGEQNPTAAATPDTGPGPRPDLLDVLNRALKIEIRKIVKYGGNGGTFELQLADGHRVDLGDAASVLSQRNVRAAIADATTEVVPAIKAAQWDRIATAIFKCAGPAPIEDAPETSEMRWLVLSRLRGVTILDVDERERSGLAKIIREDAQRGHWAFRGRDGNVMVQLGGLLAAIRLNHGILLTFKEGGKRLRKLGWKPKDLDGQDADGRVCVNVWLAPRGWEQ